MNNGIHTSCPSEPHLLFLAYYFPPVSAVAALRTYNIAKQLACNGWRITVVTPSPEIWSTTDPDDRFRSLELLKGFHRLSTGHKFQFLFPDYHKSSNHGVGRLVGGGLRRLLAHFDIEWQVGWVPEVRKACAGYESGSVDLILASGGPFVSFGLARELSERLRCPYVIDYRDLWNYNPHLNRPRRIRTARKEQRLLQGCALALAVAPSLREELCRRFGKDEKISVIWNGFDPEELEKVTPQLFPHFAIVYTGIFYIPTSTIRPLMEALRILKESAVGRRKTWSFHYYGPQGVHVLSEARRCGVLDHVVDHGVVKRAATLSAIRGANVAVVIPLVSRLATLGEKGIVTGKIFEPLGMGTPVLLVAPDGNDAARLVQATGVGGQFHGEDPAGIASYLASRMAEQETRAAIPPEYSWNTLGRELDQILRTKVGNHNASPSDRGVVAAPAVRRGGFRTKASRRKALLREDYEHYCCLAYGGKTRRWFLTAILPGFQALAVYRFGHWLLGRSRLIRILLKPLFVLLFLHIRARWGIEVDPRAQIGKRFSIYHHGGIFIGSGVVIGDDVSVRPGVVIGTGDLGDHVGVPTIGNNVTIFPGAKIAGKIRVGDGTRIGPNSVVLHSVPDNSQVQVQLLPVVTFDRFSGPPA